MPADRGFQAWVVRSGQVLKEGWGIKEEGNVVLSVIQSTPKVSYTIHIRRIPPEFASHHNRDAQIPMTINLQIDGKRIDSKILTIDKESLKFKFRSKDRVDGHRPKLTFPRARKLEERELPDISDLGTITLTLRPVHQEKIKRTPSSRHQKLSHHLEEDEEEGDDHDPHRARSVSHISDSVDESEEEETARRGSPQRYQNDGEPFLRFIFKYGTNSQLGLLGLLDDSIPRKSKRHISISSNGDDEINPPSSPEPIPRARDSNITPRPSHQEGTDDIQVYPDTLAEAQMSSNRDKGKSRMRIGRHEVIDMTDIDDWNQASGSTGTGTQNRLTRPGQAFDTLAAGVRGRPIDRERVKRFLNPDSRRLRPSIPIANSRVRYLSTQNLSRPVRNRDDTKANHHSYKQKRSKSTLNGYEALQKCGNPLVKLFRSSQKRSREEEDLQQVTSRRLDRVLEPPRGISSNKRRKFTDPPVEIDRTQERRTRREGSIESWRSGVSSGNGAYRKPFSELASGNGDPGPSTMLSRAMSEKRLDAKRHWETSEHSDSNHQVNQNDKASHHQSGTETQLHRPILPTRKLTTVSVPTLPPLPFNSVTNVRIDPDDILDFTQDDLTGTLLALNDANHMRLLHQLSPEVASLDTDSGFFQIPQVQLPIEHYPTRNPVTDFGLAPLPSNLTEIMPLGMAGQQGINSTLASLTTSTNQGDQSLPNEGLINVDQEGSISFVG